MNRDPNYRLGRLVFYLLNISATYIMSRVSFPLVVFCILQCLNVFFYEKCAINPGIVKLDDQLIHSQQQDEEQEYDYPNQHFCDICNILQLYRTKHCDICGVCVYKFDHHCCWIGTCVGEMNQKYFLLFIYLQNAVTSIVFYYVYHLIDSLSSSSYYLMASYLYILFLALLFNSLMVVFHSYLAINNVTTWEKNRAGSINYMKYFKEQTHKPFDQGVINNLKLIFCSQSAQNWKLPQLQKQWRS